MAACGRDAPQCVSLLLRHIWHDWWVCWGWRCGLEGEHVKTLSPEVPSQRSLAGTSTCTFDCSVVLFKQTFTSTASESVTHPCVSQIWTPLFRCTSPILPLHDELVTTLESQRVQEIQELTTSQRARRSSTMTFLFPHKSPQILDRSKSARGLFVDWR